MDLAYFKVFGLQRSGTNLTQALLSKNFHVQYLDSHDTGWKHGPLRLDGGLWRGLPVRFVLCVKSPYAWAVSCYRFFQNSRGCDPTMAPQFQKDPSMSFEEFLLTPHYSFQTPIHRWNQMNRLWLATLPSDRTLVVRQEDQLHDQVLILQAAEKKLSLKRRLEELVPIDQRVDVDVTVRGAMNRNYYIDRQYLEWYSPCLLERVNTFLDPSLMQQLTYPFQQWALEQRQIGPMRLFVRPCTSDAADAWQITTDPFHVSQIKQRGDPITTIVDVGAEIGAWALFANGLWPDAQLFVHEPSPEKSWLLRMNTRIVKEIHLLDAERHCAKIDLRNSAVPTLSLSAGLLQRLKELGQISLLRIGDPQAAPSLIRAMLAHSLLFQVTWVCARLPPEGFDQNLLQAMSGTHQVEIWATPDGTFLSGSRRCA